MADPRTPTASRPWVLPAVVVTVLALVLAAAVLWSSGDDAPAGPAAAPGAATAPGQGDAPTDVQGPAELDPAAVERRDPEDPLAAGPVDAPVVLVVFSDYQCPFCAQWSHETLPEMMQHAEDGDLRIEYRDVNVFGEASERAARAAYAAGLQDEFWAYHDALYPEGEKRSEAELSEQALTDLAAELGLDVERFTADMASSETAEAVAANEKLGLDLGAYSTPAFLLGGEPIVGAQPTQVFRDAYDAALAASAG
ncbi:DsbA family protein [Isoptericola sediminis]|uniref:Thioredoxin domain-containing protein n=1 Tax=Isoptericola sediminis TaxID=2733572 RepID=A0A849JWK7_9MICO|nr:thioredoxin domain-containing protein [Isoptericola sediminis]